MKTILTTLILLITSTSLSAQVCVNCGKQLGQTQPSTAEQTVLMSDGFGIVLNPGEQLLSINGVPVQPTHQIPQVPTQHISSPEKSGPIRNLVSNAQSWAQREANILARRGRRGYRTNGHPSGACPYGGMTGTGYASRGTPPSRVPTCTPRRRGMRLVADATATSDGIYRVRVWR